MDIKITNILGTEKPLLKLVDTFAEALGCVANSFFEFDAKKIKRIGDAEAMVEKKKIISDAEAYAISIDILKRAGTRFALDQYNKQKNLENIFDKTRVCLTGVDNSEVSDIPVEKDWVARFMDTAQNVSKEEMQDILAKIMSGEIKRPGSFSYQTLEVVKYLSDQDLKTFKKYVEISSNDGCLKLKGVETYKKIDLDFTDYLNLASIGIFNQSSTISYEVKLAANTPWPITIGKKSYVLISKEPNKAINFNFGLYVFSRAGRELRSVLLEEVSVASPSCFVDDFLDEVDQKGVKVVSCDEV